MLNRRLFVAASLAVSTCVTAFAPAAWAQEWPSQSVRVVVPYGAGGPADIVARQLMTKVGTALGQRFQVENRTGAGGTTGMGMVAKSPADGYTLAFSAISPVTLSPHLSKLPYNAERDLTPVVPVMYAPVYVMATGAFAGKTWDDVIAQAKERPGTVRFATSGVGSVGHIMLEHIQAKHGVQFAHLPYKGAGQLVNDATQNFFDIMVSNPFDALTPMFEQNKLRVLAVTGPQRISQFPNAPTLAEKGLPEANLTSTFGIFAPAGVSDDVVKKLNDTVQKQLADPAVAKLLSSTNNVALKQSAADFAAALRKESQNNASIVKRAGIHL